MLEQRIDDSVDLDWDEVDVGEREDSLPLSPAGSKELLTRIALTIIVLSILAGLLGLGIRYIINA